MKAWRVPSFGSLSDSGLPLEWALSFAEIDQNLVACTSTPEVYAVLTATAVRIVPGAEFAGITAMVRGGYQTRAATSEVVDQVDAIQYRLKEGPCVDAAGGTAIVRAQDLTQDERWPAFRTRMIARTPVRSMLSLSLVPQGLDRPILGLNLYATRTGVFDDYSQAIGAVLAGQGIIAVVASEARAHADQLETALANSRDIGIAMGVLMRAHAITRDAAFELLRGASQQSHRKLAEIARDVAETGTLD